MAKNILEPAGDHVLVIDTLREATLDGISLPDNEKQQEMVYGYVVFVGPQAAATTKEKDRICYGPYAGKHVLLDGVQFRLIRVGQIEAYVREIED